ncbi:MAG: transcriptional repressor [Actinobacteria bacterium]|nr:MAG: transcriptional repressor [Actinomycetota bacterium]
MADPCGDTPDVDQVAALRLRRVGQRLTPRRRSLLEILTSAVHPLTIHEILDRGTGLAMSSAYRNLTVLEHAGVVNRVITREDLGRYELAEELTEHHHHLVCSSCGLVRDLGSDADAERLMNVAMRRATEQGFTPATHRLDIVGLCADCTAGEPA